MMTLEHHAAHAVYPSTVELECGTTFHLSDHALERAAQRDLPWQRVEDLFEMVSRPRAREAQQAGARVGVEVGHTLRWLP